MRFRHFLLALALALPCLAFAAGQQAYRWTDTAGTVHFSDKLPPSGVDYTVVDMQTGTRKPGSDQNQGESEGDYYDNDAEQASADTRSEEVEGPPQTQENMCQRLASNIDLLSGDGVVVLNDTVLSAEDKAAQLKVAKSQRQRYCQQ